MKINIENITPKEVMDVFLWSSVEYFNDSENWGDYRKMNVRLIFWLDALRRSVNLPIVIHNGYEEGGHKDGSQHYLGRAVDLHIEGLTPQEQVWEAMKFPFTGIGMYEFWNNPGLHLDTRVFDDGRTARKMWKRSKAGIYLAFNRWDLSHRGD